MAHARTRMARFRAAFSARLRRLRLEGGLTQKDLERASGIPKSRISRYENGHLLPSLQGLNSLARSLGLPDSALLADVEDPYVALVSALRRRGVNIASVAEAEQVAEQVAAALRRPVVSRGKKASARR